MACPQCGAIAERVYRGAPVFAMLTSGIRKEQSRYYEENEGARLVELGNEKSNVKPPRSDVNMREVIAYAEKLQSDRGEKPNVG